MLHVPRSAPRISTLEPGEVTVYAQAMNFGALEKESLDLPMQEGAKLAQRLLKSLDDVSDSEAEQLWLDVAIRRAEEIDQGKVKLVTAQELEAQVQALLK